MAKLCRISILIWLKENQEFNWKIWNLLLIWKSVIWMKRISRYYIFWGIRKWRRTPRSKLGTFDEALNRFLGQPQMKWKTGTGSTHRLWLLIARTVGRITPHVELKCTKIKQLSLVVEAFIVESATELNFINKLEDVFKGTSFLGVFLRLILYDSIFNFSPRSSCPFHKFFFFFFFVFLYWKQENSRNLHWTWHSTGLFGYLVRTFPSRHFTISTRVQINLMQLSQLKSTCVRNLELMDELISQNSNLFWPFMFHKLFVAGFAVDISMFVS